MCVCVLQGCVYTEADSGTLGGLQGCVYTEADSGTLGGGAARMCLHRSRLWDTGGGLQGCVYTEADSGTLGGGLQGCVYTEADSGIRGLLQDFNHSADSSLAKDPFHTCLWIKWLPAHYTRGVNYILI